MKTVSSKSKKKTNIDPKVSKIIDNLIKKYDGVWRDLAKV